MSSRSFAQAFVASCICLALMLYADVASAQVDLSGAWASFNFQDAQIRGTGPNYADYLGVPLNASARAAAVGYSATTIEELQRECQPYPLHYVFLGLQGLIFWPTYDRLSGNIVAWNFSAAIDREPGVIWMDGRPHPGPQALHTFGGFTTGVWHGNTLETLTTHLADGYLLRNGVPSSNQETMTMFITRHGDLLTITAIIRDPVYLTAPYILSRTWQHTETGGGFGAFYTGRQMQCAPQEYLPMSDGYQVAAMVPANNPMLHYMPDHYHIPLDAALGGEQTMFPQFAKKLNAEYTRPSGYCKISCCTGARDFIDKVLHCPTE